MKHLSVGKFVKSNENNLGIGKLLSASRGFVSIEYFDTPADKDRLVISVKSSSIIPQQLFAQTRVFYFDKEDFSWHVGRVLSMIESDYLIQFPNKVIVRIPEAELFVRWDKPIQDPTLLLANRFNETPFFHQGRSGFMASLLEQRGASGGITGLISAAIDIENHQVKIIRRVLNDPVQRYLLADEVGLGKTIEAGVLIRQHILDYPELHLILIVVPPHLEGQWKYELSCRFFLERYLGKTIFLVSSNESDTLNKASRATTMLVVDEAHQVAGSAYSYKESERQFFAKIQKIALSTNRLLLLSATPVLHNEAGFLAMLHLLDPTIYNLDDVDAFRQRIQKRQEVAEVFFALQEDTPAYFLGELAKDLKNYFPEDNRLTVLLNKLDHHLKNEELSQEEDLVSVIRAIRTHVSETYRLHRRLLRNRRSKELEDLLPGRDGLDIHAYTDPLEARIERLLEEWRIEASLTLYKKGDLDKNNLIGEMIKILLEICASDLSILKQVARVRLGMQPMDDLAGIGLSSREVEIINSTPTIIKERELLAKILNEIEQSDSEDDRFIQLVKLLRQYIGSGYRIVIFTTFKMTADVIHRRLRECLGDGVLRQKIEFSKTTTKPIDYHLLPIGEKTVVLICDRTAEEGLNLQGGKVAMFHYDLPFSPNRIEQRLGRLDRYGVGDPVRSVALLNRENLFETAWLRCLNEAFKVFNRSIAALQYLVEERLNALWSQILFEGVSAIENVTERLAGPEGEIANELKRIKAQDEMDAIESNLEEDDDFFDRLVEVDSGERDFEKAADGWIVNRLNFRRIGENGPNDKVFRYGHRFTMRGHDTLVPVNDLVTRFKEVIDTSVPHFNPDQPLTYALSYRRQTARARGVRVARLGEPFIDAMLDYLLWDDRGRCFAMWRHRPRLDLSNPAEIAFRFDFIVEARLDQALEVIKLIPAATPEAIRRRADSLFPPIIKTVWINEDFHLIKDERRLLVLQEPYYSELTPSGVDYNLNNERWSLIERLYDSSSWQSLCLAARRAAEEALQQELDLKSLIANRANKAKVLAEVHLEQMRTRLSHLEEISRQGEERQLKIEESLAVCLINGITDPVVRLDALGVIFLSRHDPFKDKTR